MSARLLLGKPVAESIKSDVRERVSKLSSSGKIPLLATIRVGERAEDVAYERSIRKSADSLGIAIDARIYAADVDEAEVLNAINELNADSGCSGILLFRPLPKHLDEMRICEAISPSKDVDGVGAQSLASVFMGARSGVGGQRIGYAPATAQACIEMLEFYGVPILGQQAVVVGRSLVVGKPVGMMLLERDATVAFCHSRTHNIACAMREADIVVCATGRARLFGAECFREGQVVLDVGINDDGQGGICGDVDTSAAEAIVDAITPVPGGVGSVSTAVLLRNVVDAAEKNALERERA